MEWSKVPANDPVSSTPGQGRVEVEVEPGGQGGIGSGGGNGAASVVVASSKAVFAKSNGVSCEWNIGAELSGASWDFLGGGEGGPVGTGFGKRR